MHPKSLVRGKILKVLLIKIKRKHNLHFTSIYTHNLQRKREASCQCYNR